jgi:FixJ family two-component response regulator
MTTPVPVVHVVDGDRTRRSAVARWLRMAGFDVFAYASALDFLRARAGRTPGCVLLDAHPPGLEGPELEATLAERDQPLPVVPLTKALEREVLLDAVRDALARDAQARSSDGHVRALRACYRSLTPREREVFALVVVGLSNRQMALELGAAERTIKAHRARIMMKMQVESLADLMTAASELRARPVPLAALARSRA